MSKVIVFTNENGGVSVCMPSNELPVEFIQGKDIPAGVQSFIIDASTLPETDNDFFSAWEQTNGVVSVNLTKAKEVTRQRLRVERVLLLAAQDVAFQRAIETGADTSAIVAEKQRLRDITKLPDACKTLDELRSIKAK